MHRLTAPTNPNTAPTKTGEVQADSESFLVLMVGSNSDLVASS